MKKNLLVFVTFFCMAFSAQAFTDAFYGNLAFEGDTLILNGCGIIPHSFILEEREAPNSPLLTQLPPAALEKKEQFWIRVLAEVSQREGKSYLTVHKIMSVTKGSCLLSDALTGLEKKESAEKEPSASDVK